MHIKYVFILLLAFNLNTTMHPAMVAAPSKHTEITDDQGILKFLIHEFNESNID